MSKLSDAVIEEMRALGYLNELDPRAVPPQRPVRKKVRRKPAVPPAQEKPAPVKAQTQTSMPEPQKRIGVNRADPQHQKTQQTVQPQQPKRPEEPAEPAKPVDSAPRLQKAQYQVLRIKHRMSKLDIKNELREFLQSLHDFDINVVKNTTDISKMKSFILPLKGDAESLSATMEALIIELEKLEEIIGDK